MRESVGGGRRGWQGFQPYMSDRHWTPHPTLTISASLSSVSTSVMVPYPAHNDVRGRAERTVSCKSPSPPVAAAIMSCACCTAEPSVDRCVRCARPMAATLHLERPPSESLARVPPPCATALPLLAIRGMHLCRQSQGAVTEDAKGHAKCSLPRPAGRSTANCGPCQWAQLFLQSRTSLLQRPRHIRGCCAPGRAADRRCPQRHARSRVRRPRLHLLPLCNALQHGRPALSTMYCHGFIHEFMSP